MNFQGKHPKHEASGAILWPRHQPYICGDRMRGTVLLIMEHGILEMVPEYAKSFAEEMLTHASDVRNDSESSDEDRGPKS